MKRINEMSIKELREFMYFSKKNLSLADLSNCYFDDKSKEPHPYTFIMKDGTIAKSDDKEMYESTLDKKIQYDLYVSSINHHLLGNVKYNKEISDELNGHVKEAVNTLSDSLMKQNSLINDKQNEKITDLNGKINEFIDLSTSVSDKWEKVINKMKITTFNKKIDKLDKIIEAFDSLLK